MNSYTMELQGKTLTMETGKLAKQASGSVLMRHGDTVVLVTATVADQPREGMDFLPLTVDYEERLYAVGRIPGGFIKREGRPTERAVLACRLTDRSLRPLFPRGFRNSIHIVATVLSMDQDCPPEPLAIIGASAALSISKIPFEGPIAAVVTGLNDGEPVVSPNQEQTEKSTLHLMLAGSKDAVLMVEAGADEVSKEEVLRAIQAGHETIKELIGLQEQMVADAGVDKMAVESIELPPEMVDTVSPVVRQGVSEALKISEKQEREEKLAAVKHEVIDKYLEQYPENELELGKVFENTLKETLRKNITENGIRPDGRSPREIRPITCEISVLPRTHGSAIFTRGQTQVLNICTLSALRDMQMLDGLGIEESKRFMHHYNFPPYSVGETGFMRGPGRREIGHGALAERALLPVLPPEDEFPYTLRLVSEALASNGSTSMASVCASTLALMDAGVGIKAPVAGIAMGLIKEGEKYAVLSDIQGIEDHLGDMDFKVAGTTDGITALQMDIKIRGVDRNILSEALAQAKAGRNFILDKMLEVIPEPREEMSRHAPRIVTLKINPEKIRYVIGPGGKMINSIVEDFGVQVDIEDDGTVYVASDDAEGIDGALERIRGLTEDVEVGKVYKGTVKRIVDNLGAFVEILPNQDGLVHVSKLDTEFVDAPEDVVTVGDEILVKLVEVDKMDRINLSREACIKELGREAVEARETRAERKELTDEEKAERARKRRANSGGKGRNDRKRR